MTKYEIDNRRSHLGTPTITVEREDARHMQVVLADDSVDAIVYLERPDRSMDDIPLLRAVREAGGQDPDVLDFFDNIRRRQSGVTIRGLAYAWHEVSGVIDG